MAKPTYLTCLTRPALLGPYEHKRSLPVFVIKDEARAVALQILEGQVYAVGVEIHATLTEERHALAARRQAQQPEGNRDPHQLAVVRIVGEHAQRFDRPGGRLALEQLAVEQRLAAAAHFDQCGVSGKSRPRGLEFLG